ncbi:MAG: outer membrane protein assembly factor BamC [Halieaceae bacterium]|nr:outer membrane protein assembly factor BamC [Halieaceae bacterium]
MMLRALALLCAVSLAACSWLPEQTYVRDRSDDYRKARIEPRLKVPEHLEDDALQDIYVIPATTESMRPTGSFEVPRPAPLVAQETEELVRIQRLGDEEWVLAAVAPGQLWPQVRSFLTTNGVQVARVDARAGLIETGWFQGREATMNERYQFRIEQGVQRNTSELHVLQQFQAGDINAWPEASADAERGSEMLLAVAQYIANSAGTAPVSMMAQQAMGEGGKVTMQEDPNGEPFVRLSLPYYRAWASVDRALRESSFTIRDLDRSGGLFYVRFVPPEEDEGWFGWLFGGDDEEEDVLTQQDYVFKVSEESSDQVRIDIAREDGADMTRGQMQQLLALVKGNIN